MAQGEAPGALGRARLPLARTARYPGGCAGERRRGLRARQRCLWADLGMTWGWRRHVLGRGRGRSWGFLGSADGWVGSDVGGCRPLPVERKFPGGGGYVPRRMRAAPTRSRTDASVSSGNADHGHQRRSRDSPERCSTLPGGVRTRNCTSRWSSDSRRERSGDRRGGPRPARRGDPGLSRPPAPATTARSRAVLHGATHSGR